MRTSAPTIAGALFAALLMAPGTLTSTPLSPQQRSSVPDGTATAAAQSPGATATPNANIEETTFKLRRTDIDAKLKTLPAAAPAADAAKKSKSPFGGLTDSLKKSVAGDERREEAAKLVVQDLALQASANNTKTVVVVIGNEDDRAKVKASMGTVQRHVVLALLDRGVKDDTYDNSVVGSGLQNQLTGSATNVWIFIPRNGQKAHKADETLSTRVINDKVWTALFAADGDLPVDASSLLKKSSGSSASDATVTTDPKGTTGTAPAATASPAAAAAIQPPTAFAVGEVVRPKIANVKVMAQPSDSAKSVASLGKTDELVVIGGDKDGFTNVQSAAGAGWVKTVMLAKP